MCRIAVVTDSEEPGFLMALSTLAVISHQGEKNCFLRNVVHLARSFGTYFCSSGIVHI
jgi:hypothetical protein